MENQRSLSTLLLKAIHRLEPAWTVCLEKSISLSGFLKKFKANNEPV